MPTTTTIDPVQLAARAAGLRRLAGKLADCPVGSLTEWANHETWIGPTADRCRDDLAAQVHAINAAVESLVSRARHLDNLAAACARPLSGPY
jgi:hypothetical protein